MKEYFHIIKNAPLLKKIKENDLETMLDCLGAYMHSYKKGDFIALPGEKIDWAALVVYGRVEMIIEDVKGGKSILGHIAPLDLFGESFACGAAENSNVSFAMAEDGKVLFLPFKKVIRSCDMACTFHHRLVENMVAEIAGKNHTLMKKVEILSQKTLRQRIMMFLSDSVRESGTMECTVPMGRVAMAEYLCADRSALTRELSNMRSAGIIDYDKNRFTIL